MLFAGFLILENPMPRNPIHSDRAPKAIGPYSQAVSIGNTIYFSGDADRSRDR